MEMLLQVFGWLWFLTIRLFSDISAVKGKLSIFQIYTYCRTNRRHGQLGVFSVPSLPRHAHRVPLIDGKEVKDVFGREMNGVPLVPQVL